MLLFGVHCYVFVTLIFLQGSGNYKGVKLASGQELFSHNLILAPSFVIPSAMVDSSAHCLQDDSFDFSGEDVKEKLVKGICIAKCSLKPDVANCLVFFPPRCMFNLNVGKLKCFNYFMHWLFPLPPALFPDQVTSIHVFQLSSNVAVCPSGMWVISFVWFFLSYPTGFRMYIVCCLLPIEWSSCSPSALSPTWEIYFSLVCNIAYLTVFVRIICQCVCILQCLN